MRITGIALLSAALLSLAPRAAVAQEANPCFFCRPIVSVDAGVIHNQYITEPVAELYMSAESLLGVRPYAIFSWTPFVDVDPGMPVIVTQLAYPVVSRGPFWLSADAGATWFFRTVSDGVDVERKRYEPEFTVSSYAGYALPLPRTHVFGLLSAEPANDWDWTVVTGVALTLFRGK